ncbi:hypothetical protein [Methylomonas sp. AM2-LC]|uniref:hypothetical protein n=1 Tax=Methylomonas sp. AM2-LC TaxID=3153301 RepID=UPI003263E2DB
MSKNYDKSTVQPNFPSDSVTKLEKLFLSFYGFEHQNIEENGINKIYFFSHSGVNDEIDVVWENVFDFDEVKLLVESDNTSPIALHLKKYFDDTIYPITEKCFGDGRNIEIDNVHDALFHVIQINYSWPTLFQGIMAKSGQAEIVIEGAYYSDKMRPGEFGGWVARITPELIQSSGTQRMFSEMRQESAFLDALDILYQLASANCADNELDPEDPNLDDVLVQDCIRQRNALNLIHDYIVNHQSIR